MTEPNTKNEWMREAMQLREEIKRLKSQWTSVPEQYDNHADFVASLIDDASKFDAEFAAVLERAEKAEAEVERLERDLSTRCGS